MANHAALAHGLVLIHERTLLRGVALEAGLVLTHESEPAALERLLNICPAAFDRHSDMWVVAIGTTHFAFQNRMTMRQLETRSHIEVTLETSFWGFARIDNCAATAAAGFDVQTSRAVTRFATDVLCVLALRLQAGMRRRPKIAHDILVAGSAFLRAYKLCPRDAGWSENRSI